MGTWPDVVRGYEDKNNEEDEEEDAGLDEDEVNGAEVWKVDLIVSAGGKRDIEQSGGLNGI